MRHWGWQNQQQKGNTTYIGDGFAVLFFDGMSKERKNTKGQSAICEGMEKYKTKIQSVFLHLFCIKINPNAISQKYKIQKKIRTKNFKNTKYKQKNTNPKFQKYKIQKIQIQQWAREPTPCSFWKARTNLWNKCKANLLYFLNPAIQILYFWVVCCSYLFCLFNSLQKTLL